MFVVPEPNASPSAAIDASALTRYLSNTLRGDVEEKVDGTL
jgi:hypothetical protein